MTRRRQWVLIAIGAVAALIAIRAALPYFVTRYVNRVLQEMPDYGGSVANVDISLLRGAYTIDELEVFKVSGETQIPFIDIPQADFSVEWGALLHGNIAGEAVFHRPTLNFINKAQAGENVDWAAKVKELMPIRINRLEIVDGTVTFYDFSTEPDVDLRLEALQLVGANFANVEDPAKAEQAAAEDAKSVGGNEKNRENGEKQEQQEKMLPASIRATAVSIGGGELDLDMRLDPLRRVPDLDMNLRFEGINMPALNNFFRAYAKVDVEQGTFSVYSEMAVKDGVVKGYIKPVAENMEIVDLQKDSENPVSLIWQTIVDVASEIFKSERRDQVATQIPLSGDLNNVETSVWVALWNIYRNGFVQAFSKSTNDSIDFGDVSGSEKRE